VGSQWLAQHHNKDDRGLRVHQSIEIHVLRQNSSISCHQTWYVARGTAYLPSTTVTCSAPPHSRGTTRDTERINIRSPAQFSAHSFTSWLVDRSRLESTSLGDCVHSIKVGRKNYPTPGQLLAIFKNLANVKIHHRHLYMNNSCLHVISRTLIGLGNNRRPLERVVLPTSARFSNISRKPQNTAQAIERICVCFHASRHAQCTCHILVYSRSHAAAPHSLIPCRTWLTASQESYYISQSRSQLKTLIQSPINLSSGVDSKIS
jgi:hypothetical protein